VFATHESVWSRVVIAPLILIFIIILGKWTASLLGHCRSSGTTPVSFIL